ncbi:MAG: hypothetical protein ACPGPS_00730 [Rubripirellula sp.]
MLDSTKARIAATATTVKVKHATIRKPAHAQTEDHLAGRDFAQSLVTGLPLLVAHRNAQRDQPS